MQGGKIPGNHYWKIKQKLLRFAFDYFHGVPRSQKMGHGELKRFNLIILIFLLPKKYTNIGSGLKKTKKHVSLYNKQFFNLKC